MEADVGEGKTEEVLPVNPGPNSVGRLPVGQSLHELENEDKSESGRRRSRLPYLRKKVGEVVTQGREVGPRP